MPVGFLAAYALKRGDEQLYALRHSVELDADQNEKWIHVLKVGEWKHPNAKNQPGGKLVITKHHLRQMYDNFQKRVNPVNGTYEHPSHEVRLSGQPIPASFWTKKLELRNGGNDLWAYVKFTPRAAEFVRNEEYKFCSSVFRLNSTHKETGELIGAELREIGLTNTPYVDGLEAIEMSEVSSAKGTAMPTDVELFKRAMKELGDDATEEQLLKLVAAYRATEEAKSGKSSGGEGEGGGEEKPAEASLAEPPDPAATNPEGADAEAAVKAAAVGAVEKIAEALGVTVADALGMLDQNMDAVLAALKGGGDGAQADQAALSLYSGRISKLEKDNRDLQKQLIELSDAAARARIKSIVESNVVDKTEEELFKAYKSMGKESFEVALSVFGGDGVPLGSDYKPKASKKAAPKPGADGEYRLSDLNEDQQEDVHFLVRTKKWKEQDAIKAVIEDKEQ